MNPRDRRTSSSRPSAAGNRTHVSGQDSPAPPNSLVRGIREGLAAVGRHDKACVLGLILGYALLYSLLSVVKYRYYLYRDFDLAIFAHAADRLLHGALYESIGGRNWLGDHVSLVMMFVAPLYAVFRHPILLLVLQSVALALGAWPVFQLARREVGAGFAPVGLAAAYLMFPALGYLNLFEFHPEALATPALLFAFTAMRADRLGPMLGWASLALSTREDVALVVMAMALFVPATRAPRSRLFSAALAGLAVASLLLSFGVILPRLGSGQTSYFSMYSHWGASVGEVLSRLASHPLQALAALFGMAEGTGDNGVTLLYHLNMLLPLAFLPLASPSTFAIALPVLFEHLLSARMQQHSVVFHYTALVIPFYVSAAVIGLGNLVRLPAVHQSSRPVASSARADALVIVALGCSLISNLLFGPLIGHNRLQGVRSSQRYWPSDQDRTLRLQRDRMLARVPNRAGIVTSFEYLSHFASHEKLYSFHHLFAGQYTYSPRPYRIPEGIDALLTSLGDQYEAGAAGRVRELIRVNGLRPVASADDLLLFLCNPPDTLDLLATGDFSAGVAARVVYDGQLGFMGCDALATGLKPQDILTLRTYWRRVAEVDRRFITRFWIYDEQGKPALFRTRYLGYGIETADRWPLGRTVRETYRIVLPARLPRGSMSLVMQVVHVPPSGGELAVPDDPKLRDIEGFLLLGKFESR